MGTNRYAYSVNDPVNNADTNGHGWLSTVWKFIKSGGSVSATTAGAVEDATTLVNPAASGWRKTGAALSLGSEFLPVSVRDVKAGGRFVGHNLSRGWRWLWGMNPNKRSLVEGLVASGKKITPENVVDVTRLRNGRDVWLETGSSTSGLQHILERHASNFADKGISADQIPALIFEALDRGRIMKKIGSGANIRDVYRVEFNDSIQTLAIGISENGWIGMSHPYNM